MWKREAVRTESVISREELVKVSASDCRYLMAGETEAGVEEDEALASSCNSFSW